MPQDATNKLPPELVQALSEQLRDVHLPDAVSWWPLAWGWWVLLTIIVLSLSTTAFLIYKSMTKNRYRGLAANELNTAIAKFSDQPSEYLQTANATLKRVILHTADQSPLATLSGQAWVNLLNEWSPNRLSESSQNALAYECYQAHCQTDIQGVHKELLGWLKKHKPQLTTQTNLSQQDKGGQHA